MDSDEAQILKLVAGNHKGNRSKKRSESKRYRSDQSINVKTHDQENVKPNNFDPYNVDPNNVDPDDVGRETPDKRFRPESTEPANEYSVLEKIKLLKEQGVDSTGYQPAPENCQVANESTTCLYRRSESALETVGDRESVCDRDVSVDLNARKNRSISMPDVKQSFGDEELGAENAFEKTSRQYKVV